MAWEAVADLDQLEEGDMMVVQMHGQPICVVRLYEDDAVAVHNTCTHQQQPLNEGYLQEDDTLICPAHNSCFDLRTGEPRGVPAVAPIPVYACKIEDDAIWVDFDQQLNDAEIPHKPSHCGRARRRHGAPPRAGPARRPARLTCTGRCTSHPRGPCPHGAQLV